MAAVSAIPSSLKPSTPVKPVRVHDADSAVTIRTSFSAHFGP